MFSFFKKCGENVIKKNAASSIHNAAAQVGFDVGNNTDMAISVVDHYCNDLDKSEVLAIGSEVLAVVAGVALADHSIHMGARGTEAEINNRKWLSFSEILIQQSTQRSSSWNEKQRSLMYQARANVDRLAEDVDDLERGVLF